MGGYHLGEATIQGKREMTLLSYLSSKVMLSIFALFASMAAVSCCLALFLW